MLCFDVAVNGKKVCRAGLGPEGVLTSIVTWVYHTRPDEQQANVRAKQVDLHVGGLVGDQHVAWTDLYGELTIGDTIAVAIVEAENADEPKRRESASSKQPTDGFQCSFCSQSKPQQEIVAGPTSYICAECVAVAVGILRGRGVDPCVGASATA